MAGHIEKRGENTWRVTVYLGTDAEGKDVRHRKTIHGTKKDAQKYMTGVLRDRDLGQFAESSKLLLGEYLDQWLEQAAKARLREKTYIGYDDSIRLYVKPHLGSVPLDRLTPLGIQTTYNELLQKGYSAKTVRNVHVILHNALKQAVRWRMLQHNPASDVELPRRQKREMSALDTSQAARFNDAARKDPRGIVYLVAIATGMRPGEYLALRWPDMDMTTGAARVQRTLFRPKGGGWRFEEPKTPTSRRSVILPKTLLPDLRAHRARQEERRQMLGALYENHDLVFATDTGTPLDHNNMKKTFKRILKAANASIREAAQKELEGALACATAKAEREAAQKRFNERLRHLLPENLRPYDLRHSCATLLLEAGKNPKIVAERLGHASIVQTMDTYSHVTPTMQQEAADALEGIFGAPAVESAVDTLANQRTAGWAARFKVVATPHEPGDGLGMNKVKQAEFV